MQIFVNGEGRQVPAGTTLLELVRGQGFSEAMVAAALNGEVVPRALWPERILEEGVQIEIVTAMAGGSGEDPLQVAGKRFSSRLFVGTGKYADMDTMRRALAVSGTELVTIAVRVLRPEAGEPILPHLDRNRYALLPNTAGATTADEAIHIARLGRELIGTDWVKLEIIGDQETLWPDTAATVEATRRLIADGFVVLAYTSPDLVSALRLEDAGAAAVMPLAAPIGSGEGFQDWAGIARIRSRLRAPMVVDAGLGVPSDAAVAMELGADAVLVNTAIARARIPEEMAKAMRLGVEAGRRAYLAGRIPRRREAEASSPLAGVPGRSR